MPAVVNMRLGLPDILAPDLQDRLLAIRRRIPEMHVEFILERAVLGHNRCNALGFIVITTTTLPFAFPRKMQIVRHTEILARDLKERQARRIAEPAPLRPRREVAVDGEQFRRLGAFGCRLRSDCEVAAGPAGAVLLHADCGGGGDDVFGADGERLF